MTHVFHPGAHPLPSIPAKLKFLAGYAGLVIAMTSPLLAEDTPSLSKFDFEGTHPIPNWGACLNGKYNPLDQWPETSRPLVIDTTNPHSGAACLKIINTGNPSFFYTRGIQVNAADGAAEKLNIRFFVRTQNVVENALDLQVLEQGESSAPVGYLEGKRVSLTMPVAKEWTEVVASGQLNPRTKKVVLLFLINSKNFAAGTIWIDDLSVESRQQNQ